MTRTEEIKNKEYKEVVFTADDGSRFVAHNCGTGYWPSDELIKTAEQECKKYEQSCEYVVGVQFKEIGKRITGYAADALDNLISGGNQESQFFYVQIKTKEDIATLLKYMRSVGDTTLSDTTPKCRFCIDRDLIAIGKNYILAYWPDSPWMYLFEVERFKQYVADTLESAALGKDVGMFAPDAEGRG